MFHLQLLTDHASPREVSVSRTPRPVVGTTREDCAEDPLLGSAVSLAQVGFSSIISSTCIIDFVYVTATSNNFLTKLILFVSKMYNVFNENIESFIQYFYDPGRLIPNNGNM